MLNTYFVTLTLLYYLPKRVLSIIFKKELFSIIREGIIKHDESNFKKAASIGFGFFMGIVPLWGFQLLIGIPLAIFFRMNKVLFIASANISIPPMIPLIIFLSYYVGGFFVENNVHLGGIQNFTLETIHINILQYAVGATFLAVITGLFFFACFYFLLSLVRSGKKSE